MTKTQRELLAEHGPYTIARTGEILDVNGVALARLYFPPYVRTAWDDACLAALNEIARGRK